jgi:hypothetical protein
MPAGTFNLTGDYRIEQGATFTLTVTVTTSTGAVYPLTAMTAAAILRETKATTAHTDFTVAVAESTGVITVSLTATETAAITITSGYWDLELTSGATVTLLLEGTVEISQEVTK